MDSPRKETAKFIPTILLKARKDDRQIVFEPNTSTVLFNWTRSAFFTVVVFYLTFPLFAPPNVPMSIQFSKYYFHFCPLHSFSFAAKSWKMSRRLFLSIQHFLRCAWTKFPSISCSFSYFWIQSIAAIKRKIFIYQNKRSQLCKSLWQSSILY